MARKHSAGKLLLHPLARRFQGRRERLNIRATTLRHVRTTTALSTQINGDTLHQVACFQTTRHLRRHTGNQRYLVLVHRSQQNDRSTQLVLQLIHGIAQGFRDLHP